MVDAIFQSWLYCPDISGRLFSQAVAVQGITDQDIDQIAAIPEVRSVRYTREGTVNLILRGEIPKYLQDTYVGEYQAVYYEADGTKYTVPAEQCFNAASMFGSGSLKYLLLEEMPEMPVEGTFFMGLSDQDYYRFHGVARGYRLPDNLGGSQRPRILSEPFSPVKPDQNSAERNSGCGNGENGSKETGTDRHAGEYDPL